MDLTRITRGFGNFRGYTLNITFEDQQNRVFNMKVAEGTIEGVVGYRRGNHILLNNSHFHEFFHAHCASDFLKMKEIIDQVVDLTSRNLSFPGGIQQHLLE